MYINQVSINSNAYYTDSAKINSTAADKECCDCCSYNDKKSNQAIMNIGKAIVFTGKSKAVSKGGFPKPTMPVKIRKSKQNRLLAGGTRYMDCFIGKLQKDGSFAYYNEVSGLFGIEKPADNPVGYTMKAEYDNGKLCYEDIYIPNDDGTYTVSKMFYENGKPTKHISTKFIGTYKLSTDETKIYEDEKTYKHTEYFYIDGELKKEETTTTGFIPQSMYKKNKIIKEKETVFVFDEPEYFEIYECIDSMGIKRTNLTKGSHYDRDEICGIVTENDEKTFYTLNDKPSSKEEIESSFGLDEINNCKYDSSDDLGKEVPNGYYYDRKNKKLVEINKNELSTTITSWDDDGKELGKIEVFGKNGKLLGSREYEQEGDDYYFYNYDTAVSGAGIGSLIMKKSIELADRNGKGIIGHADGSNEGMNGALKKATNLGFYYKMGYRAQDEGVDKLIQECLDRRIEIPTSLNIEIPTRYVGKNAPVGSGAKPICVRDIQNR